MKHYYDEDCVICARRISRAGAAYVSHMRKHVREGLLVERRSVMGGKCIFERTLEPLPEGYVAAKLVKAEARALRRAAEARRLTKEMDG